MLEIDFGDGVGYRTINPSAISYILVNYTIGGAKHIKTRIKAAGVSIMTSIAEILTPNRSDPLKPTTRIHLPGLTAGIYEPCVESGGPYKKTIIYLSGYDPGDFTIFGNRDVEDIYDDMIHNENLAGLLNYGYTYCVVDWKVSGMDIRAHAMELVQLLKILKCEQASEGMEDHQFVMIGESMGGLVARYALTWMEQNYWMLEGCNDEKMHNTRLLITFDSPHQGANIPLAYQHLYRKAGTFLLGANSLTQSITGTISNFLLDATSVKQMLRYHVDTKLPGDDTYTEHPARTEFMSDLEEMGNYPQYCKLVALANGSISGIGQTHFYDTLARTANDYLLQYEQDVFARVFRDDIQILGTNFHMKTSPNGSGNIALLSTDFYRPKLKISITIHKPCLLCFPKVRVKIRASSVYHNSISNSIDAEGMEPVDVAPGSPAEGGGIFNSDGDNVSNLVYGIFFGLKHPDYDVNTHVWSVRKFAGGGVFGGAITAFMYTDGLHFCFVPTVSALDYDGNLFDNIETTNINTKLGNTPFDVICGIPWFEPDGRFLQTLPTNPNLHQLSNFNIYYFHRDHLNVRNTPLGLWRNGVQTTNGNIARYEDCEEEGIPIHWLNREIGDDSLFVENRTTAWTCDYDVDRYMGVNERGNYYEYPNHVTNLFIPGIYSKEDNYVNSNGTTSFLATNSNVNVSGFVANHQIGDIDWERCCNTDNIFSVMERRAPDNNISDDGYFIVFPNPANEHIIVSFPGEKDENCRVQVYDMVGRVVWSSKLHVEWDGQQHHRLDIGNNLSAGTYIVTLQNNNKLFKKTIVITE